MKNSTIVCAALSMLLACAGSSSAALIFSDNFDAENGGDGALNYTGFANWTVTEGAVDLIPVGTHWDLQPGPGLFLDMDGSSGAAGTIESIALNLNPGQYVLSFEVAGNQRTLDTDSMDVSLGGLFADTVSLGGSAPWGPYSSGIINVGAPTSVSISFAATGRDNVGLLIDNVSLNSIDVIPAPGAILLGSIGAALVGWLRRRRTL